MIKIKSDRIVAFNERISTPQEWSKSARGALSCWGAKEKAARKAPHHRQIHYFWWLQIFASQLLHAPPTDFLHFCGVGILSLKTTIWCFLVFIILPLWCVCSRTSTACCLVVGPWCLALDPGSSAPKECPLQPKALFFYRICWKPRRLLCSLRPM